MDRPVGNRGISLGLIEVAVCWDVERGGFQRVMALHEVSPHQFGFPQ
jgi:hypothetical protein